MKKFTYFVIWYFSSPIPDCTINYMIHRRFPQSVSFVHHQGKKKDGQEKNETKIIG